MYIKYELYRAKNQELFNAEMIEWVLEKDEDIIELPERMTYLLTQHIQSLPEVQKYGTGYIGRMKLAGIEINDNDYTSELDEERFREYIKGLDTMNGVDIVWNKGKKESSAE